MGYTYLWSAWISPTINFQSVATILASGGVLGFLATVAKKIQDTVIKPFDLNISEYIRTPDYKQRVGFLHEFETDFKFVIEAITHKGKSLMIVFIDDLDRCKPAKPVEVIEAINHLLDGDSCVFIIGMDARNVAASVPAKYKDVQEIINDVASGMSTMLGYQFLEKIVQITFRLPKASECLLTKLVHGSLKPKNARDADPHGAITHAEKLLTKAEATGNPLQEAAISIQQCDPQIPKEAVEEARRNIFARTFDDDDEVRKAICDVVPFLEMNARKIKRFINLFRLNILVANRRRLLERGVIQIGRLARWITIVVRWPDFVDSATDQAFLSRLSNASRIWETSHGTSHPQTTEHATTLLSPYLEDPRIRRF